ncbi:Arm DNA-binding domain-containing protein [Dyadobacter sp. 3J3]|uniref:Arm DNA-binding domain-containing protein n=1 Tax=Dyadobacter sp. 3J3 TaxID=2606600 RepID=UPI001E37A4CD|nr:Arm DNA-binding domain-containing protein [Dyadobacter sp. 3J3]
MLEKSFGLLFYLKPAKNQKGTVRYVYLRITVEGKIVELSTKELWETKQWNSIAGRATGVKEDSKTLNAYLDMLTAKVHQAKKMLVEDDKEVTAEALKNILLGKSNEKRTILEVFQYHNEQMEALVGKEFAPLTLSRYKTALEIFTLFLFLVVMPIFNTVTSLYPYQDPFIEDGSMFIAKTS